MRLSNEVAETMFIGKEPNSESNKIRSAYECHSLFPVTMYSTTAGLEGIFPSCHFQEKFHCSFSHGKKISDTITVAFSEVCTR